MKQRGFTLIELVIVIIVLGILAATAVPKFINLQDDAEKATLSGFAGALTGGIDVISAKHELEGRPGHLQFNSPLSPVGYYNVGFRSLTGSAIEHYPAPASEHFCEGVWNTTVEGTVAKESKLANGDTDITVTVKVQGYALRCNYKYKDIGSIYYMSGEGRICIQYEGDNIPDTCNI